jgi:hypothetical protein
MTKLTLKTPLLYGKYKGEEVKKYADEDWYSFHNWYEKKPFIFADDVRNYVKEVRQALYRNRV